MKKNTKLIALFISASVVGSAVTLMATSALQNKGLMGDVYVPSQQTQEQSFVRTTAYPASVESDFTRAAESTINSVVSIKSYATPRQQQYFGGDEFFDPFEFFFGQGNGSSRRRQQQPKESNPQPSGLGSGVIISSDGYIVTNNHVIDGAEKLEVTLNDNRQFTATVVGTDANSDIALIKIPAKDLKAITFGSSDKIKVGEWVLAVGNPLGLNNTVTAGIVSAKARSMGQGVSSMIQTDAAINQGNSGGALVNTAGALIGINAMIYSQTGSNIGYGFAIPTTIMNKVVDDLKKYGNVQRAMIGIQGSDVNAYVDNEKEKGNEVDLGTMEGIYIAKVIDDGAAADAGLKEGDVITHIDDQKVKTFGELQNIIAQKRPGDKISINYLRNKSKKTATLTLKNEKGNTKVVKGSADLDVLGGQFKPLTDAQKEQLNIGYGLQVMKISGGRLKDAGVPQGFIIQRVNDESVKTIEDLQKIVREASKSKEPVLYIQGIYPTGKKGYFAVPLEDE